MNRHILLFDTKCPQCTSVAKRLRELEIPDLEVGSLHAPEIADLFAAAERPVPDKPALVHATAQGLTVHTGLAMRMRMARKLGARRAAEIIGLMAAEIRAHIARRDGDREGNISRRKMLGGTAAAGAGALIFGAATSSPAAASPGAQEGASLSVAAKHRLLAMPTLQRAGHIWGEIDESAITTSATPGGEKVAILPHGGESNAFTAVSLDSADTPAITITPGPDGNGIRYFLAESGTPLMEQTVHNGQVSTDELDIAAAPPAADPQPDGVRAFTACFVACAAVNVTAGCILDCVACATGNIFQKAVYCPQCAICAGNLGVSCANQCKSLL